MAEAWIGDHPSGPAIFWDNGETVALPYLVKVLSVAKCLSIQVHPNKEQAAALHGADSLNYPDDEHKPEMLVAVTRFEAFVGWNDSFTVDKLEQILRGELTDVDGDTHPLFAQYPNDRRSVLIALRLMNHVVLEPGECLMINPGTVHAYFKGEGIEVMAKSDNVVRLGLTSKYCDRKAFWSICHLEPCIPDVRQGKRWHSPLIGVTVTYNDPERNGIIVDTKSGIVSHIDDAAHVHIV